MLLEWCFELKNQSCACKTEASHLYIQSGKWTEAIMINKKNDRVEMKQQEAATHFYNEVQ